MKTPQAGGAASRGSVLLGTLVFIGVVGIALAGYLALMQSRAEMASRSQSWNFCVALGEAGLEEAMAHLNQTRGVGLSSNGWTLEATNGVYSKQVILGDGCYYSATISTNIPPVVESTGFVRAPARTNYISRRFRLTTQTGAGMKGLIARGKVTVQHNAYADSYDSTDPLYSTNGVYTPGNAGQNSFIGSLSTSPSDLLVKDSAKVVGTLGTLASNVLSMSSPARVGDLSWVGDSANDGNVQSGHHDTSLNVPVPTETVPAVTYFTGYPPAGTVAGTNYDMVFNNGNYTLSNFTIDNQTAIVVGNCILHVSDSFYANGTATIYLTPGSKLDLYVGSQFYAQGSAQINTGGLPSQFTYHGLPSNLQAHVQGAAKVVGTFSAPDATVNIQDTSEFSGAGLCKELVFQGDSKFHYDESLKSGGTVAYQIASWSEL